MRSRRRKEKVLRAWLNRNPQAQRIYTLRYKKPTYKERQENYEV